MDEQNFHPWSMVVVFLSLGVVMLLTMMLASGEAMAMHNKAIAMLVFSDEELPDALDEAERAQMIMMRRAMISLENFYTADEHEKKPDLLRVQAFFYALFFGDENPQVSTEDFYRCFQSIDGKENSIEAVYGKIEELLKRSLTEEELINASELYYRLQYGFDVPDYGAEFDAWIDMLPGSIDGSGAVNGARCVSPIMKNWRSVVSSEFGLRQDPISGMNAGHGGIDLAVPSGSAVFSAWGGTVQAVRYSRSGYGYHVVINHGNGVVTLYAHCSKLLVIEGETVAAGDVIALSGNTGKSTGPHLHFEIRINGESKNPRMYLP